MNFLKSFSRGKEKLKNSASSLVHNVKNSLKEQVTKTIDSVQQSTFVQDVSNSLNEKIWNLIVTEENRFDFEENHYYILGQEEDLLIDETAEEPILPVSTEEETSDTASNLVHFPTQNVPSKKTPLSEKNAKAYLFTGMMKAQKLKDAAESVSAKEVLQRKFGTKEQYEKSLRFMAIQEDIVKLEKEMYNLQSHVSEVGPKRFSNLSPAQKKAKRKDIFGQLMQLRDELSTLDAENLITSSQEFFDLIFTVFKGTEVKKELDAYIDKKYDSITAHMSNFQKEGLKDVLSTGFQTERNFWRETKTSNEDQIDLFQSYLSHLPTFSTPEGLEMLIDSIIAAEDTEMKDATRHYLQDSLAASDLQYN